MLYKVDLGLSSDADMYIKKSICTGNTVGHTEHIGQKYYVLAHCLSTPITYGTFICCKD